MYIYSSIIILSSTISLTTNEPRYNCSPPSPTLNQPIENLSEIQTKQIIEKILIDAVQQELDDKK